ncbi:MAG: type III pantothenate kinase, partial [Candidatus Eisenbacteria bacterium]
DRIADAVAGFAEARGAVVVVDLGTATTFNAVNSDGVFLGGAIAPGVRMGADALAGRAARLHRAELAFTERAIGRSTDESIRSGVLWGAASMIDGMVARIRDELGGGMVIATGGLSSLVAPRSRSIDRVDPLLSLKGLRLLYERNRSSRPPARRE